MSATPAYYRVYLALRNRILDETYDRREPLPAERLLCAEHKVSRGTLRRALQLLEQEGLLVRRQGAKTYPRALGYNKPGQPRNLDMLAQDSDHEKLFYGEVAQQYEVINPDKQLAPQFPDQPKLGRIVRTRLLQGKPYCFVVTYMPLEIANRIDWADIGSRPVITAVIEAGYNFAKIEQVVRATAANEESAAVLQVPVGAPILCVSGLFIDQAGNSLMRKDGYFRPESFEYRMTLLKE